MKFKLVESIDDRLVEKRLDEFLSESKFKDPLRTVVKIYSKELDVNKLQEQLIDTITSKVTFKPEVLIAQDGSYQICFPGKADRRNIVIWKLKHEISDKLKFDVLDK